MTQQSVLRRPAETGTVTKTWRVAFKSGSQSAGAQAMVKFDSDPEIELSNRRAAEQLAREAAEQKYLEDYHEPIDWPRATALVTHTSLEVMVYINVEV